MIPLIAGLALGSGGAGGMLGGGILSSISSLPIVSTFSGALSNPIGTLSTTLTGVLSNPVGTISSIGSTIGGIFSSKKGAVQLADRQTGKPNMQGVMFMLHDINQQNGGIWLAGEDCSWVGDAWNDNISGVYIAPGFEFTFYDDLNFGGKSFTLSASDPVRKPNEPFYLNGAGQWWNDKLSSFKIRKVDSNAKSFPELMPQQKVSNLNVENLGDKPMPIEESINASTNSFVDLPTSSVNSTTEPKSNPLPWIAVAFIAWGLITKKIKL